MGHACHVHAELHSHHVEDPNFTSMVLNQAASWTWFVVVVDANDLGKEILKQIHMSPIKNVALTWFWAVL